MLDVECSVRGCPETYVQKVKVQHKESLRLFEPHHCDLTRTFGIHHYAGRVVYDTTDFLGEILFVIGGTFSYPILPRNQSRRHS